MSEIDYPEEIEDSDDMLDDIAESLSGALGDDFEDIFGDDDHIQPDEF